jgi:hypothetical protein
MSAIQGRRGLVKVTGAATAFTGEATTRITANTVYQITNAAKRIWDRSATITVKKDAVTQAANLYTLNRLTGTVTFLADIGGAAVVTVDGSYLPTSNAAEAKSFAYELMKDLLDSTSYDSATADNYHKRKDAGLENASGSLGQWSSVDRYFETALIAGDPVVVELWADRATAFDIRFWALLNKQQIQSAVDGLVGQTVEWEGTPDVDGRVISG